jgi:hypothetical protein
MTSNDFIPFKRLAGDLLISQRKNHYRMTLTTKELIFQKAHMTYYLLLDDLLGIFPAHLHQMAVSKSNRNQYYQLKIHELHIITRSQYYTQSPATLVLPFHSRFLRFFCRITGLTIIE